MPPGKGGGAASQSQAGVTSIKYNLYISDWEPSTRYWVLGTGYLDVGSALLVLMRWLNGFANCSRIKSTSGWGDAGPVSVVATHSRTHTQCGTGVNSDARPGATHLAAIQV